MQKIGIEFWNMSLKLTMKKFVFALMVLPLFASGCGLMAHKELKFYDGDVLPLERVASIAEGQRLWSAITKVDGNPIGIGRFTKGIHVIPGEHEFTWQYLRMDSMSQSSRAEGSFTAVVKAGHSYVPIFSMSADAEHISVELIDKGLNYNQECLKDVVLSGKEQAVGC